MLKEKRWLSMISVFANSSLKAIRLLMPLQARDHDRRFVKRERLFWFKHNNKEIIKHNCVKLVIIL